MSRNDTVELYISRLIKKHPDAGRIRKREVLMVIEAACYDPANEAGSWNKLRSTKLFRDQHPLYASLIEYMNEPLPELFPTVEGVISHA